MKIKSFFVFFVSVAMLGVIVTSASGLSNSSMADKTTVHIKNYAKSGTDVSDILQKLVNNYQTVIIDKGTWVISKSVLVPSGVTIKGLQKDKCIIKADANAMIKKPNQFCVFSSVEMKSSLVGSWAYHNLPIDAYSKKTCKDIHISNLTFDINRHPAYYTSKGISMKNKGGMNAIRLENSIDCTIQDCIFIDYGKYDESREMTNGEPIINIIESESCSVSGCETSRCAFVLIAACHNISVEANKGNDFYGTWIETIGGSNYKICNNVIGDGYWNVSTLGINSINTEVAYNEITSKLGKENSSITLGHDTRNANTKLRYGQTTKADGCYVHDNIIRTAGVRGIIAQSASNLVIENNDITCAPVNENSTTQAGISFLGEPENFKNEIIRNNVINITSGKGCGIVGTCLNASQITNNEINAKCDIGIWLRGNVSSSLIDGNQLIGQKSAVKADNVQTLSIRSNNIDGGSLEIKTDKFTFEDNTWVNIPKTCSIKGTTKEVVTSVDIERNNFSAVKTIDGIFEFSVSNQSAASNNVINKSNVIMSSTINSIGSVKYKSGGKSVKKNL